MLFTPHFPLSEVADAIPTSARASYSNIEIEYPRFSRRNITMTFKKSCHISVTGSVDSESWDE